MSEPRPWRALLDALPFWLALTFVPVVIVVALQGGLWLALLPIYALGVMSLLDGLVGETEKLARSEPDGYFWFKLITWIWLPIQIAMIFGAIAWIVHGDVLTPRQGVYLMLGIGLVTGATGIVFAHELIHRTGRGERRLGEWLLISVLYGHFTTEHLLVHHVHVATPRDAVTARYNESFYRFFLRVLPGSFRSAWRVERDRLARRGAPVWAWANPFWRYLGGAALCLGMAWAIGGWFGVGLYVAQAYIAIVALEQINYVEHYGLTRNKRDDGSYEPVAAHHSWNANHRITNYLMINLQRHSDHHINPARRYPDLAAIREEDAPQLPFSYPAMALLTYIPPLWRRLMNPKVKAWRARYYPDGVTV